ncbi:MAG: single-stranded DNA-binding protein [Candidatus Zixiibacteriota bacterium]
MASVNKAILIGNLGADPELRYTSSGQAVVNFNIATTEKWKDKDGQMQESTEWHRIILWKRQAEIAKEYLKKGSPVYIEGRIQTRNYEDKDGIKRYITEIVGQRMQFLGSRGAVSENDPSEPPPAPPANMDSEDDDLPF